MIVKFKRFFDTEDTNAAFIEAAEFAKSLSKDNQEYMENCARLGASLFDHTSNVDGYSVLDDIMYLTCVDKETGINIEC